MQQLSAVEKASLRRYMYLLEKVQGNKPLTVSEIKELEKYENEMKKKTQTTELPTSNFQHPTSKKVAKTALKKKKISPAGRNDRGAVSGQKSAVRHQRSGISGQQSAVNLAALLKQAAFEGKTIAQIETELPTSNVELSTLNKNKKTKSAESVKCYSAKYATKHESAVKSLNDLFAAKPELKAAFERGRFLREIADYAATSMTIAEVEIERGMKVGELETIFAADFEAAQAWNSSRHKKRMEIKRAFMNKAVETCSIPAIKQMDKLLGREIARPAVDFHQLTTSQMMEIMGVSRQTLQVNWPENGLKRNSDGTYNLMVFVRWYEDYLSKKLEPKKAAAPEALRDKKAEMLDIELKEKIGQLLDRKSVVAGLLGREQLDKNMYDKLLDKVPALVENQPMERIRKILEEAYIEIKNEKTKYKIELKLGEDTQKLFDVLMVKI